MRACMKSYFTRTVVLDCKQIAALSGKEFDFSDIRGRHPLSILSGFIGSAERAGKRNEAIDVLVSSECSGYYAIGLDCRSDKEAGRYECN